MISSLRVVNFKAFEDQSIGLRPLTILSGLNGMGKSTVLQSFLLLRQSFDRRLLQNNELDLNGELISLGTGKDILFDRASEDVISFELVTSNGSATWNFFYNRSDDVLSEGESTYPDSIFDSSLFNDEFHYLQAERLGPRVFNQTSEYMVRQHKQIGSQGEYAAHFLSTFGANKVLDELVHPKAQSNNLNAQVEAWMSEISPGIRLTIQDDLDKGIVSVGVSFERERDVSNQYKAINVGFGISYTLPILVAVLSAKPDALILLENPEAHLHPQGQAQIGILMARAASVGVQIICETHSDHILNGIRYATKEGFIQPDQVSLHHFSIEEGKRQHYEIVVDEDGDLKPWPNGFFDEYEKMLMKLV